MSAPSAFEELCDLLQQRYGEAKQVGRSRHLLSFGGVVNCSINYSKVLRGERFFFGLPQEVVEKVLPCPVADLGEFVILICGSARDALVLPRPLVLETLESVPTRKLDVSRETGRYILQTTKHPKLDVTEYLNAFPEGGAVYQEPPSIRAKTPQSDRDHVRFQSALIDLGVAEGCSVWVPAGDRCLAHQGRPLAARTMARLPHLGFDENTRRIVQNIDVLWLARNVIRKAFEIECSTAIYSGLLRLNDLVLAQPNNQIELYVVASRSKRQKVFNQLIRPSFRSLIPRCAFFASEDVEEQLRKIEPIREDQDVRISGLVKGERFTLPDAYVYPSEI